MNRVLVKLAPTKKQMTGFSAVGAVTVSLSATGKGTSAVTTTSQSALFELVEIPKPGDATQTERVLYSIAGNIVDNGSGVPVFDGGATTPTTMFSLSQSDFSISLTLDSTNFTVFPVSNLVLPWESSAEGFTQEVRARLTIAGTVESTTAQNDTLDLTMKHIAVPDDGTNTQDTSDCFGISTVYPTKNDFLKPTDKLKFPGTMTIMLEDAVGQALNAITPGSYTLAALTTVLGTIMTDAGLGTPTITEFNRTTTAAAAAMWSVVSGQVVATGGAGVTLPFFTYWVFADSSNMPQTAGEFGNSEGISPPVNVAAATKLVMSPIILFTRSTAPFNSTISATQASDVPNALATMLAHEIGHSLGLRHGLNFDVNAGTYSIAGQIGAMTGLTINGARANAQLYGPVHKDVIKKLYL
ncbi:MAG: hypothetical protein ABSE49_16630 [Polyangiaceae bacterium]